jgi:hypothetical protein
MGGAGVATRPCVSLISSASALFPSSVRLLVVVRGRPTPVTGGIEESARVVRGVWGWLCGSADPLIDGRLRCDPE